MGGKYTHYIHYILYIADVILGEFYNLFVLALESPLKETPGNYRQSESHQFKIKDRTRTLFHRYLILYSVCVCVCVCVCLCVCVRVRMCQFSFPKARLWECLKKLTMPKPKQRWTSLFMGHQPFVMQSRSRRCLEFQIQPPRSSSPNLSDHESRRAQSSQLATSD